MATSRCCYTKFTVNDTRTNGTFLIAVCEYFVHTECQDFAVADCKENATYLPGKDLAQVKHTHHWREGNLPSSSKCAVCKKTCFSAECLSGFRCEWCGMTVIFLFESYRSFRKLSPYLNPIPKDIQFSHLNFLADSNGSRDIQRNKRRSLRVDFTPTTRTLTLWMLNTPSRNVAIFIVNGIFSCSSENQ